MSSENGHAPRRSRRAKVDLVGTAEAAAILGVERPRIGRWIHRGVMPEQAVETEVAATPLWHRADILAMRDWVNSNRRQRVQNPCACGCGEEAGVYTKTVKAEGRVKGEPRKYAPGHNPRRTSRSKHLGKIAA